MKTQWHLLLPLLMAVLCPPRLFSQEAAGGQLSAMVDRLRAFGGRIPQEKVYIHMDNTSYFQGDTIWFSAYTRQTSTGTPSQMSGVLYVELFNHEGYMMERRLIEMKNGRGDGYFVLDYPVMYSGFYELRAYTRWQLNWGVYEHRHSRLASEWFLNKKLEKEYYRDYEKLYSRVFPVYDRPANPADPDYVMTPRVLRRRFRNEDDIDKRKRLLTFYPEGGDLLAGVPCRVAFEAAWDDGEWLEGTLEVAGRTAAAVHRGRGVCTVTAQAGERLEAVFRCADGNTISGRLPAPKAEGAALRVWREGDHWRADVDLSQAAQPDSVGLTLMREGNLCAFHTMTDRENSFFFENEALKPGVHQLTVFNTAGTVLADRLFFVSGGTADSGVLAIRTDKETYAPYEKISLSIAGRKQDTPISVAVRDRARTAGLHDNGSILTEMLLSSEIRGFIPNPEEFFEADDEPHRQALDLLMLTQGWRRFAWRDMALKSGWDLTQPAEKAPIITGEVYDFDVEALIGRTRKDLEDDHRQIDLTLLNMSANTSEEKRETDGTKKGLKDMDRKDDGSKMEVERRLKQEYATRSNLKREVKVHAELVCPNGPEPITGEASTQKGRFRIQLPRFYGQSILFISAADTTKWREGERYTWVQALPSEDDLPESGRRKFRVMTSDHFVRMSFPYPNFVKPYSHYQCNLPLSGNTGTPFRETDEDSTMLMPEVVVKNRRARGLRKFDDSQPAILTDACEAWNRHYDAGMVFAPLARVFVGDYGLDAPYVRKNTNDLDVSYRSSAFDVMKQNRQDDLEIDYRLSESHGMDKLEKEALGLIVPPDSVYHQKYLRRTGKATPQDLSYQTNDDRFVISKLGLYTDYCPRQEGSKRYAGADLPETEIVKFPYPDEGEHMAYRDRRYIFTGFSYPAECYNPDYSKQTPPDSVKDYRRTLYWNPNVMLDREGKASITLYNNARTTQIQVEAAGQAADGTLLWNKE